MEWNGVRCGGEEVRWRTWSHTLSLEHSTQRCNRSIFLCDDVLQSVQL